MFTDPVLVLAYNKPELLSASLSKLRKIHSGNVYIHLDGPQANKRSIDLFNDCKKVIEEFMSQNSNIFLKLQKANLGGQFGVLSGIDWFFSQEEFGVILEEDIDFADGIFLFVKKYKPLVQSKQIFSICFFNPGINVKFDLVLNHWLPWGWATSSNNWKSISAEIRNPKARVNLKFGRKPSSRLAVRLFLNSILRKVEKGEVKTWDAQVHASHLNNGFKTVFPSKSYSKHLGFVPEATHADQVDWWEHIVIANFEDANLVGLRDSNNKIFETLWRMSRLAHISNSIHKTKVTLVNIFRVRKH